CRWCAARARHRRSRRPFRRDLLSDADARARADRFRDRIPMDGTDRRFERALRCRSPCPRGHRLQRARPHVRARGDRVRARRSRHLGSRAVALRPSAERSSRERAPLARAGIRHRAPSPFGVRHRRHDRRGRRRALGVLDPFRLRAGRRTRELGPGVRHRSRGRRGDARRADRRVRARFAHRACRAVAPPDGPADIGGDPRTGVHRLRAVREAGHGRARPVRLSTGTTSMIEVRELRRAFGGVVALDGVTLTLALGERRAVIGPNGAGKTTLINTLAGETAPTGGTIRLAGRDITRLRSWQRARLGLAHVYQRTELFASLSARDNVGLAIAALRGPYRVFRAAPRAEYSEGEAVLESVGLAGREGVAARELSHGERRQLELAVTLAQRPRVLLLDEPTAGMSPLETARITELIAGLDRALTILIVEHDMDVVFRLADRVTVLHEGRVIADGTAADVRGDVRVHDVYLGKAVSVA